MSTGVYRPYPRTALKSSRGMRRQYPYSFGSFFDHFLGSSLHPRWKAVTGGSGSVTVSDSEGVLDSPAATDHAFIHYAHPLDITKSQIWMFCIKHVDNFDSNKWSLLENSGPPVGDTFANFNASRRLYTNFVATPTPDAYTFEYRDNVGSRFHWNAATDTWVAPSANTIAPVVQDDYYIEGFEFDAEAGNSRWRMFAAHQTVASGFSNDQGLRIFAISDWVNWSATDSVANGLWLILGNMATDIWAPTIKVEWVRAAWGPRRYIYTNSKNAGSGNYFIRTSWGYDRQFFMPKDRTTTEASDVKDPWVVFDGTTYHMFFRTQTGTVGEIHRHTSSSKDGPWTFQNTVASPPVNHTFSFPCVVNTPWEVAGREWQMLCTDFDSTAGNFGSIRLFTASTPGGTWTDQGIVLSPGAGGSDDVDGVTAAVILHRNGEYEVWYSGFIPIPVFGSSSQHTGLRATGPALDNLSKDGVGARITHQDVVETLTANLSGNIASMTSTTGFEVDMPVYFNQDTNGDNWAGTKIRKVNAGVSLELVHRMMGFTTASNARAFGASRGNMNILDIVPVGREWYVYFTTFWHTRRDDPAIWASFQEECSLMIVPEGTALTSMAVNLFAWQHSPVVYRGTWNNIRSNENLTTIHGELAQSFPPPFGAELHNPVFRPRLWTWGRA